MSLALGVPGGNDLCSPRVNIDPGAPTDSSGRGGQEGDAEEGNSRQNEHVLGTSMGEVLGWGVLGVHLPLC